MKDPFSSLSPTFPVLFIPALLLLIVFSLNLTWLSSFSLACFSSCHHLSVIDIYDIITESEQLEKNGFDLNPVLKMAIMRKVIIKTEPSIRSFDNVIQCLLWHNMALAGWKTYAKLCIQVQVDGIQSWETSKTFARRTQSCSLIYAFHLQIVDIIYKYYGSMYKLKRRVTNREIGWLRLQFTVFGRSSTQFISIKWNIPWMNTKYWFIETSYN